MKYNHLMTRKVGNVQDAMRRHIEHYEKNKDKIALAREIAAKANPSCISKWLPIVSSVPGVNIPKTRLYPIHYNDQIQILDGIVTDAIKDTIAVIQRDVQKEFTVPFFIKNSLFSGKHDWDRTCFVQDPTKLFDHFAQLTSFAYCVDCGDSLFWVVREMLDVQPAFHAFFGKMPVTCERRYFIKNGSVTFHHPYWPPQAVKDPSVANWEELLTKLNVESDDEIATLKALSEAVAKVLPGEWSLDWLKTRDGTWYLIDAAIAGRSYRWGEYEMGTKGLK
jgi:hypothetical protein